MRRLNYDVHLSPSKNVPAFLMKLKEEKAQLSDIHMANGYVYVRTDRKGLALVRKYRRKYHLKASIRQTFDDLSLMKMIRPVRWSVFLLIPFLCSFFLWSVTVESEGVELNERVEATLRKSSILPFRLLKSLPDESFVRRQLMKDEPSLSWVHFNRSGTTLTVIPMLSPLLDQQEETDRIKGDLVAKTGGVITNFALTKGERVARVFSTVTKGELLASGTLQQGEKHVLVGAEGKVYADYWVEYQFSIPKNHHYKVRGEESVQFSFERPILDKGLFNLKNWHIIKTETIVNEEDRTMRIDETMEKEFVIPFLTMKLLNELNPEATIKDEKLLQVTYDSDKVKGTILFLINDNIAMKRPITQGD